MKKYVLSLDQGTSSSRAVVFDLEGSIVSVAQKEFTQYYPQAGWVEHDPAEILTTQLAAAAKALQKAGISPQEIAAIGIANQRETTVVWEKQSGKPVYNAIVWQCRRTSSLCDKLTESGLLEPIRKKTGLLIDAYFSGTKVKWILDNIPGVREKAKSGTLLFGTVDTWLLWNLTEGKVHATDYSNASRTMLYNIHTLSWDAELLNALDIPACMLPEALPSSHVFGFTHFLGCEIPVAGIAGDQQAALLGQACFTEGSAKNTYGTGCFILLNTGEKPIMSNNKLLSTIAWGLNNKITYALEGSVFNAGTAVQWLRDGLKLIRTAAETEQAALSVPDTNGVFFIPAFTGLGAPYWDMYARGTITGITRGTSSAHIIRAALESIAYQSADVLLAMEADAGITLSELKADGGASMNNMLMQFQSDLLQIPVLRPKIFEATALGVFYLAGLALGLFSGTNEIGALWQAGARYTPKMSEKESMLKYAAWKKAVIRSFEQAEV